MATIQCHPPLFLSYTHHHKHLHSTCTPNKVTYMHHPQKFNNGLKITTMKVTQPLIMGVANYDDHYDLHRCVFLARASSNGPYMKGPFGASPSVTLEMPKPDLQQNTISPSPEPSIGDCDNSGNGGNNGKDVGGGDNGGSGFGDEDDYFDDFDDDDDEGSTGLFRMRTLLEEIFDRRFIDALLREWQRTLADLPAGMHQAYELGIISSAEVVKFIVSGATPTLTRALSRALPQGMSRAFIGRMIADPAFLYKLLFEQVVTIVYSVRSKLKYRGDRIRQEWDLALINVLTVAACNLVVVWSLAPCRSFGDSFRFNLQNKLQKLPNNIFEANYCFREFDTLKRIQAFIYKAVQLSFVGFTAGAVQSTLSNLCAIKKEGRLSVQIPPANVNALGYGAFLGLYTNWRYKVICGIDKVFINHFDVIGVALFFTLAFRILNVQLGEVSRTVWLEAENFTLVPQKAPPSKNAAKRKRIVMRRLPAYDLS